MALARRSGTARLRSRGTRALGRTGPWRCPPLARAAAPKTRALPPGSALVRPAPWPCAGVPQRGGKCHAARAGSITCLESPVRTLLAGCRRAPGGRRGKMVRSGSNRSHRRCPITPPHKAARNLIRSILYESCQQVKSVSGAYALLKVFPRHRAALAARGRQLNCCSNIRGPVLLWATAAACRCTSRQSSGNARFRGSHPSLTCLKGRTPCSRGRARPSPLPSLLCSAPIAR